MREEILRWWKQAERDLKSAKSALKSADYYVSVFLCQQAAEKALKALVMKEKNEENITSHSLIFLAKTAKLPKTYHTFLRELTPQYVLTRYPDASSELPYELYDKHIATEYLEKTEDILGWIQNRLG
jgi:HEPN domain-containing protein